MKINFLVPGPELNMYKLGGIVLPSIGVAYLATILSKAGHDVTVYDENILSRLNSDNGKLKKKVLDADAFGISILTPSANRGYNYADQIRESNPDARIVIGGWHATALPEESLEHADYVIKGPIGKDVVEVFEGNPERILEGSGLDIENVDFPDFFLFSDYHRIRYLPIAASLACPFSCPFCQVPRVYNGQYIPRDPDSIYEELSLRKREGWPRIFFSDDLYGLDRAGTEAYLKRAADSGMRFKTVSAETRANIVNLNRDILYLMESLGFVNFHVGAESATQKNLDDVGKRQKLEDVILATNLLHDNNMEINGMFIMGLDNDDSSSGKTTASFIHSNGIDTATFSILYPIPGTDTYDDLKEQGRILTNDWSLYDGAHVVFTPNNLSPLELQQMWLDTWKAMYSFRKSHSAKQFLFYIGAKAFSDIVWPLKNHKYMAILREGTLC